MSAAGPASAQLPRPGDMVAGKYVLDRLLGQGGMGAVFAAKHVKLSKAVAIKIMLADTSNPEAAQRFINEGRAAANIQNEHVVRVDDVDEEMGYAYMVLELLDGEDLSQVLERDLNHRLAPHVAVGYVLQALKGVMQAHAIGIVHRDLKPSNLFLAKRKDGSVVVKVLDFGISKSTNASGLGASPSALTSTKAMLGSPLYMSPEQLRSSKSVDHRADIWAIGIILYELISGTLPFMGDSLGELFAAILETDAAPLRTRVEGVHPSLDDVVLRCLQRRPEHRFQTADELMRALEPFASPRPSVAPTGNVGAPPLHGTAVLPPGVVASSLMASAAHAASVTGAGAVPTPQAVTNPGPKVVGGTVAFGAATPQGMQQTTGGGWQSTGAAPAIPKSKAPLIALAVGAVALLVAGVVMIAVVMRTKDRSVDDRAASSASVTAQPPPSAPTPVLALAPPAASTMAVVSAAPPAASSAPPPPTKATHHAPVTPTPKPSEPAPTPKAVEPPPKPAPKPTNTSGGFQNSR